VPLSEHEQRMLEQMERALYAEDPKFASALEGSGLHPFGRRRVYQAVAGFAVGVALLLAGVIEEIIWIGVAGFLVMLGSAAFGIAAWRRSRPLNPEAARPSRRGGAFGRHPQRRRSGGRVMDRIEERWQRRRDDQQGL
jgi:hypothetical protein